MTIWGKVGLLEQKLKTANLSYEQIEFIEKRIYEFNDVEIDVYLRYVLDNQVPTLDDQFKINIERSNT